MALPGFCSYSFMISVIIPVLLEIYALPLANNDAANEISENANLGHVRRTRSQSDTQPGCSSGFNGTVFVSQNYLENQPTGQATLTCVIHTPPGQLIALSWRIQNIKTIYLVDLQGDDPLEKIESDYRVANNYSDTGVTSEIVITYHLKDRRVYECQAFSLDDSFCEDNILPEFNQANLQVAFRGESFSLYCPIIITYLSSVTWYKNKIYGTSLLVDENIIASYKHTDNSLKLEQHYRERGVIVYPNDAHLYFPKILLVDEARYICQSKKGVEYAIILEVHVRPSVSLSLKPIYIHGESIVNASCILDEIRPSPQEFYWLWNGQRIDGDIEDIILDDRYNIRSVKNTISHTVAVDKANIMLSCVVDTQRYDRVYTGHKEHLTGVNAKPDAIIPKPVVTTIVETENTNRIGIAILCILTMLFVLIIVLGIYFKYKIKKKKVPTVRLTSKVEYVYCSIHNGQIQTQTDSLMQSNL